VTQLTKCKTKQCLFLCYVTSCTRDDVGLSKRVLIYTYIYQYDREGRDSSVGIATRLRAGRSGVRTTTVNASTRKSWSTITDRIHAQARDAYKSELSLDKRIQYVHDYLTAKVWYVAQIFTPPDDCIRILNTPISWFLWKGDIFRVPLSTLQRRKDEGGWDLIHLKAKSLALFL
jgi:hypothetical protein